MTLAGPIPFGLCAFIIIYLVTQFVISYRKRQRNNRKNIYDINYEDDENGASEISQPFNACQNINGEMKHFVDPKIVEHEKDLAKQNPVHTSAPSEYKLPEGSVLLPSRKIRYITRKDQFSIAGYQIPNNRKLIVTDENSNRLLSSFSQESSH